MSSIEYLTGTKDQVAKAAKSFRVYFSKTEEHEEGEDYMLDHSIVIYLLAPNGDFLDFFTQRTTVSCDGSNAEGSRAPSIFFGGGHFSSDVQVGSREAVVLNFSQQAITPFD